jgi:hypothetical protein
MRNLPTFWKDGSERFSIKMPPLYVHIRKVEKKNFYRKSFWEVITEEYLEPHWDIQTNTF